jgi:hypothetical protein
VTLLAGQPQTSSVGNYSPWHLYVQAAEACREKGAREVDVMTADFSSPSAADDLAKRCAEAQWLCLTVITTAITHTGLELS